MKQTSNKKHQSQYILLVGTIISIFIGFQTFTTLEEKDQIRFNSISKKTVQNIEDRMNTYREVLYSGVGLFKANDNKVSREQWHKFVKELKLEKYYPGIQGVGYSTVLYEEDIPENVKQVRSEGFTEYHIHPEGKRPFYTSIIYLEPFDWRNQRAFGYDMYSNKIRQKAMKRAIETTQPALSGKVRLVQENGKDEQAGFLLYLPLYKSNASLETIQDKYDAIKGFVYSPFRAKDFMLGVVNDSLDLVQLKVYDGETINDKTLLFNSNSNQKIKEDLTYSSVIELDGHVWTAEIVALNSFVSQNNLIYAVFFALVSCIITLQLFINTRRQDEILKLKDEALYGVSQGVIVTDKHRNIIYTNKAFEELTGYTSEYMLGKSPSILQGEETDKETIELIRKNIDKLEPFTCEILNYKKNGTTFWNRISLTPMFDNDNKLERIIGIQNDVTEKRLQDERVLFEKDFLQNILDNTNAIIALLDLNGVMIRLNKYGCDFVKYTEEEVCSQPYFWKRFLPKGAQDNVVEIIENARHGVLVENLQNAWISTENEQRIFEWSNALITDSMNNRKLIVSVGIDITKQKEYEKDLIKRKNQIESSTDISGMSFWELDANTKIITFDELSFKMWGTTPEEVGGYSLNWEEFLKLFVPKDDQKALLLNELSNVYEHKNYYSDRFEYESAKKDGTPVFIVVDYFVEYNEDGRITAYGTNYDITSRKIKEKELEVAKDKAEKALKVKSEFLANMSHEIRTPLNGIIGLTNLALNTKLDEVQRDYLTKSIESSKSLLHIINDILDYSKIEANKLQLEDIAFKLDEILHHILNIFIFEAKNKNIEFYCNVAPIYYNKLSGDPFRITQILINLVGNAIKFTEKGSVCINVKETEVKNNQVKLNFIVEDTGLGIQKERQENLFKEFSQLDNSNTRKYGGTGLGLSISKNLANLMHGDISVESNYGEGSQFTFSLIANTLKEKNTFLVQELKDKSFLVADNSSNINDSIDRMLEQFNLKITLCHDSLSLIEKIKMGSYDYILIDYPILKERTVDILDEITSFNPMKLKNVLFTCQYIDQDVLLSVAKEKHISADNILIRPFSISTLLDTLVNQTKIQTIKTYHLEHLFRGRVLLVEDNEINQLVAEQNLRKFGLEVTSVDNGALAVNEVRVNDFDMIFMDLQMPVMDGFEATKKIREFNKDIPIVALSAAAMIDDIKNTKDAGMNQHLAKPIDLDALKIVLKEYLHEDKDTTSLSLQEDIEVENIEGINLVELLERFQNNEALAYKALCDFAKDKEDIIEKIEQLETSSDEFDKLMHNLKGLSGNLSLTELFQLSSKIYIISNQEEKEALLPELKRNIQIVLNSIHTHIAPKNNLSNDELYSKEELLLEFNELAKKIESGSFIQSDTLKTFIRSIQAYTDKELATELEEALSNFNYKQATIILGKVKELL